MNFHIPKDWPVFVLDDREDRILWFKQRVPQAVFARNAEVAKYELKSADRFKVCFLDHDLSWVDAGFPERQYGNGKEIARLLRDLDFKGIVVIHSKNRECAEKMSEILPRAYVVPYGDFDIS